MASLAGTGHEVMVEDLYRNGFNAALTATERASYYGQHYLASAVQPEIDRLLATEGIVLCFPIWWGGFPAILKGWFDRIWGPGIAFDRSEAPCLLKPKLHRLRKVLAITTLGASCWTDRIMMRQPVKRMLKDTILATCAPDCDFEMLSLFNSDHLEGTQIEHFKSKIERALSQWSS